MPARAQQLELPRHERELLLHDPVHRAARGGIELRGRCGSEHGRRRGVRIAGARFGAATGFGAGAGAPNVLSAGTFASEVSSDRPDADEVFQQLPERNLHAEFLPQALARLGQQQRIEAEIEERGCGVDPIQVAPGEILQHGFHLALN